MPGTILVRECLRRVSRHLNDISPQFKKLPEQEAVDFLNDAHLAIVKFLPGAAARNDAIKLRPGTIQSIETILAADCKPADGSTPTQPIRGISLISVSHNMGADGATAGRVVRIIDQKILDSQDPDWRLASRAGTRVHCFTHDPLLPMHFNVEPPVHATTPVWVQVQFNAQPERIPNTGTAGGGELYAHDGANTAVIQVRDEFIDELVNYVVARANLKDAEWADSGQAQVFTNLWLTSMNAKIQAVTGTNPNLKRLPFVPEPLGAAS